MLENQVRRIIPVCKRLFGKLPIELKSFFFPAARLLLNRFESDTRRTAVADNSFTTFDLSRIFPDFLPVSPWIPHFQWAFLEEHKYDLTIILPSLRSGSFTAGPMTAIQIAAAASNSMSVRVLGIDRSDYRIPINEIEELLRSSLPGFEFNLTEIHFEVPKHIITVNLNERFMATAWWTMSIAQQGQLVSNNSNPPYYLIQDYEVLLHASSTEGVLAEMTYRSRHIPIFNSHLLADFFMNFLEGYSYPTNHFIIPLPKLDKSDLSSKVPNSLYGVLQPRKKTLLFYARPGKAARNLFEIGIASIRASISQEILLPKEWNFLAVGEQIGTHELGRGATLVSAPWLNYSDYLYLVAQSDIYVALMNSPHTGYPIIEAAQLDTLAITSTYANKSASALIEISELIIPTSPTVSGVVKSLEIGEKRLRSGWKSNQSISHVEKPSSWIIEFEQWILNDLTEVKGIVPSLQAMPENPRITVIASIYDIQEEYLIEFLDSVACALLNTNNEVETIFLDNGSSSYEGNNLYDMIHKRIPNSLFLRVEENLGIIGGMNLLLKKSRGEFLVPVDADDVLSPNSFSHLLKHLIDSPEIDFWYSNEYLLNPSGNLLAVEKPNFDEVLITETCFTSHLNCFRRKDALALGVYLREDLNGSHDWYTAARFLAQNKRFKHCSEYLYSWRQHVASTSYDWTSKPYVVESQKQVQFEFAKSAIGKDITVGFNENFPAGPNQRIIEVRSKIPVLEMEFVEWDSENRSFRIFEKQLDSILKYARKYPLGYIWFHLKSTQDTKKMINEINTILNLWPNSIVTGSVFSKAEKSFRPLERNFPYSETTFSTFRQVYSKSRRQVLKPNIYNVVIPCNQIEKSFAKSPSLMEDLILGAIGEMISKTQKIITSPDVDFYSQGEWIPKDNQEYLEGRYALRNQDPTTFILDYSQDEIVYERYTVLEKPTQEASMTLLTTLRGTADATFLNELANSILPELENSSTTWILFVHGNPLEDLEHLLEDLSLITGIRVISDKTPHSLHEAMAKALKHVESKWILLADYDDLLLPGAISYIHRVIQDPLVELVIGSELVGTTISKSAYYNRPIFSKLGLSLFSLFFHPIAVRKFDLENLITDKCDYVLDWEILRYHRNCPRIVQIQAPLYFWRSHPKSISNNEYGSNSSRAAVRSVLTDVIRSNNIPNSQFEVSLEGVEPTAVRLHNSPAGVCLKILSSERGLSFQALSNWWDSYPYSHYSFISDLSKLQEDCCESDFTHFIYDSMIPAPHTSIWDVELLSRLDVGVIGGRNHSIINWDFSNLRLLIDHFDTSRAGDSPFGESSFNINEHLPMAKINFPTPLFFRNQLKLKFPLRDNPVVYSSKLDFLM